MRVASPPDGAARENYSTPGIARPPFILQGAKVLWKVTQQGTEKTNQRATGMIEKTEF